MCPLRGQSLRRALQVNAGVSHTFSGNISTGGSTGWASSALCPSGGWAINSGMAQGLECSARWEFSPGLGIVFEVAPAR